MRLLGGLLLALAFFYVFSTGAMAVWSYFRVSDVVERALQEHGGTGPPAVREAILAGTADAGVPVDDRQVLVEEDGAAVRVRVRWSWPIVQYGGEGVVAVPLSVERSRARL